MSLQMHELVQSMAREITREEFNMPGNRSRLWISSEFYNALNKNKVTKEVEVLVLLLQNNGQYIPIDGKAFTRMKNLRILKICFPKVKGCWQPFAVKMSGSLDYLSNDLRLFCWHGCPFKYLPSHFYPENIVVIDMSYSNIKQLWTPPKSFKRLKIMKLRLEGNNFTSLPGSLSQLSHLQFLYVRGCKKLEVLPELPPSLYVVGASDCTSLREVLGSSNDPFRNRHNYFRNCPKLFKNVSIDREGYWCYDKNFRGFGTCVVFKCKKPFNTLKKGYSVKNFDGASLLTVNYIPYVINEYLKKEEIGIHESYMIWLHYTMYTWGWKEAKNFVTFSFLEENNHGNTRWSW
nr:NB-ARC domains-containing protein [Tanacetum cinerariifolium]